MKPEEKIILTKSQILIVDISNSIDHYYRLMQTPLFNNEPISNCNLTFLQTYNYIVDDLDISFEGSSELHVDNTARVYTYTANILYILSSNDGPRRYVGIYTKHNLSKLLSSAINSEQVKYILKYFTDNNIFTIVKDFTENDAEEDGESTNISDIIEDALEYAYDAEFITRCGIKFTNSQNGYVRFKNRLWFMTVSKHNDPSDTESEYEYEYEILQLGDGPKSNEVLFSDIYNYDGTPKFKKVYDNSDGPIFHRFYFDNGRIIDTFSKHKAVDKFEGLENMFKDVDFDIVKIIMNNTEYDFEPRENMSKLLPTPVPSGLPKCINDIKSDNTEPFTDKDYLYIIAAEKNGISRYNTEL